jgi:transcriptional regulator with XRE-family HTH domain
MTDSRLLRLVGDRARELRRQRGLTQEDMMSRGFERRYYQRIEAGEVNLCLKSFNKLAKAFGVPVSDFFQFT